MQTRTIKNLSKEQLQSKKVLVRVDFNVPLDADLNIQDDSRIKASLASIEYLCKNEAKVILVSHLGRPNGQVLEKLRLDPVAKRLSELLSKPVLKLDQAIGASVKQAIDSMQNSSVCLLENIRFYPGEEENNLDFARELASLADIYVNDAFGTAHRAHASTAGVSSYLSPAVAGLLMAKELEMLGTALENPERPLTAIIGGSKVSSKITVLKELVKKVDTILIGGGMAYTFLKSQGLAIGNSLCEDDHLNTAREIFSLADEHNVALILPEDHCSTNLNIFEKHQKKDKIQTQIFSSNAFEAGYIGLDIGPKTAANYAKLISQSRTVIWNGPLGVFEYDSFAHGTRTVAEALMELSKKGGCSIIGGGDSVSALEQFQMPKESFTHVSTGGGASLEFLEGKTLPGVACLDSLQSAST